MTRIWLGSLALLAMGSAIANQALYPLYTTFRGEPVVRASLPPKVSSGLVSGYGNMAAALLWFELINYYGGVSDEHRDYTLVAHLLTTITTMNARAEHAYYMAAVVLPWNTGSLAVSGPLLQKAMRHFPNDWRWPYYRGFNAYWFASDSATAAHYLGIASHKPDSPPLVSRLALRMRAESGDLDTALAFLDELLHSEKDRAIGKQLIEYRKAILTEKILRRIERLIEKLPSPQHDMSDLQELRDRGIELPNTLPDGGKLRFNSEGTLISSVSKKRFRAFIPPRKKVRVR